MWRSLSSGGLFSHQTDRVWKRDFDWVQPIQMTGLAWQSPADKDTVVALFCLFSIYYPVLSFLLIAVSLSCICCIDLFSFHLCILIISRPLQVWLIALGFDWQLCKIRLWHTCGWILGLKVLALSGWECVCVFVCLFLWIVGTFHKLLLVLYWPNYMFYPLTQP